MIDPQIAFDIGEKMSWKVIREKERYQLLSGVLYPNEDAVTLFLDDSEGKLLIHDACKTFEVFRHAGQLTGRGRLATFTVFCQRVCENHGLELEGERVQKCVTLD